jgi:hypothetical protein
MAFVRRKKSRGKHYYQLVRNYREEGKHRQKVLCHLGVHDTVEAAIEGAKQKVAFHRTLASSKQDETSRLREQLVDTYGSAQVEDYENDGIEYVRGELAYMRWRNPFRSSAYPYANSSGGGGEGAWRFAKEDWEMEQEFLALYVSHHDAWQEAERNKIYAAQWQKKLDELLECQQEYCS